MVSSNKSGRAFEGAVLTALGEVLSFHGKIEYGDNKPTLGALEHLASLEESIQAEYKYVALHGAQILADDIFGKYQEIVNPVLYIQSDSAGRKGDPRDILIDGANIPETIGISVKHNHNAVKHPRLSYRLDFGEKWFGVQCSQDYWNAIHPVFERLRKYGYKKFPWSAEVDDVWAELYDPILIAFEIEFRSIIAIKGRDALLSLFEFLFGEFSYYKLIGKKKARKPSATIYFYDFRGMHYSLLPSKILDIKRVIGDKGSYNKLDVKFDGGWRLSFRIHTASTNIERSFKFDIQIEEMPNGFLMYED